MILSKSKLLIIKYIFGHKKTIHAFIDKFFKFFTEDWKCRNWSVIIKFLRIIFFVYWADNSSFENFWKNSS